MFVGGHMGKHGANGVGHLGSDFGPRFFRVCRAGFRAEGPGWGCRLKIQGL